MRLCWSHVPHCWKSHVVQNHVLVGLHVLVGFVIAYMYFHYAIRKQHVCNHIPGTPVINFWMSFTSFRYPGFRYSAVVT